LKTATVMLRRTGSYQRPIFEAGLGELGYRLSDQPARAPDPSDVLVIWNRNRSFEAMALAYEARGACVIVAENGYLPDPAEKTFALALGKHNGAGRYHPLPHARFDFQPMPWRRDGREILILPQRGIGSPGVAMPGTWLQNVKHRLAGITKRPIRVRAHPGNRECVDLADDLADAWACVTWGSGAGIKALMAGVPVFHDMPLWIGGLAAHRLADDIEQPYRGSRDDLIRALSWAQWKSSEIQSGEAFRHLLQ
jgi:hypothetical protein